MRSATSASKDRSLATPGSLHMHGTRISKEQVLRLRIALVRNPSLRMTGLLLRGFAAAGGLGGCGGFLAQEGADGGDKVGGAVAGVHEASEESGGHPRRLRESAGDGPGPAGGGESAGGGAVGGRELRAEEDEADRGIPGDRGHLGEGSCGGDAVASGLQYPVVGGEEIGLAAKEQDGVGRLYEAPRKGIAGPTERPWAVTVTRVTVYSDARQMHVERTLSFDARVRGLRELMG